MNKEEVLKQISDKFEQAKNLILECKNLAKENKIQFELPSSFIEYCDWSDIGYENDWMPSNQDC